MKKILLFLLFLLFMNMWSFAMDYEEITGKELKIISIAFEQYCSTINIDEQEEIDLFKFKITELKDTFLVIIQDTRYMLGGDAEIILDKSNYTMLSEKYFE